jgi:hypothetical protein
MHSGKFKVFTLRGCDNFQLDVSILEHKTDFFSLNVRFQSTSDVTSHPR